MYLAVASMVDQSMDQSRSLFFVKKEKRPMKILKASREKSSDVNPTKVYIF